MTIYQCQHGQKPIHHAAAAAVAAVHCSLRSGPRVLELSRNLDTDIPGIAFGVLARVVSSGDSTFIPVSWAWGNNMCNAGFITHMQDLTSETGVFQSRCLCSALSIVKALWYPAEEKPRQVVCLKEA
jgi:hypothetical protein